MYSNLIKLVSLISLLVYVNSREGLCSVVQFSRIVQGEGPRHTRSKSFFSLQVFYTLHGPHFLNEKKIKWFPSTTTQKFTLQILFVDFSIKAQALLQTINLKSLQAKAQLKKSVVVTLHCCSFITTAY